jgi:hypothetical protein
VVVACWTPVLVFVAVTAAAGIAAPLASFTLPEMLPPTPAHVTGASQVKITSDAIAKILRKTTLAGITFGPCVRVIGELESRDFSVANVYQLKGRGYSSCKSLSTTICEWLSTGIIGLGVAVPCLKSFSLRAYCTVTRMQSDGREDRTALNSIADTAILINGFEEPEEQEHRIPGARISKSGAKGPRRQSMVQQLQNSKM